MATPQKPVCRRDYRRASERIRERYGFEISPRTLEKWGDLGGIVVNKRRWFTDAEIDAAIERRINAASAA
jgi:hypothetical protein